MMRPSLLAVAAHMLVLAGPVSAQEPAAAPDPAAPTPEQAVPADPAMTGGTARSAPPRAARPAPAPAARPLRQRRSYKECLQRARERGLRGAVRRSFLTRCQLGYGGRRQRQGQ